MRDKYSQQRVALLHPEVRLLFTTFIDKCEKEFNLTLRIDQGLRTIEEENALYAQGRTSPGKIVTDAKGGTSFHNYGLAIDIVRMNPDGTPDWTFDNSVFLPIATSLGLEWGGLWIHIKDRPHYEFRAGFKEDCSDAMTAEKDEGGYIRLKQLPSVL